MNFPQCLPELTSSPPTYHPSTPFKAPGYIDEKLDHKRFEYIAFRHLLALGTIYDQSVIGDARKSERLRPHHLGTRDSEIHKSGQS